MSMTYFDRGSSLTVMPFLARIRPVVRLYVIGTWNWDKYKSMYIHLYRQHYNANINPLSVLKHISSDQHRDAHRKLDLATYFTMI